MFSSIRLVPNAASVTDKSVVHSNSKVGKGRHFNSSLSTYHEKRYKCHPGKEVSRKGQFFSFWMAALARQHHIWVTAAISCHPARAFHSRTCLITGEKTTCSQGPKVTASEITLNGLSNLFHNLIWEIPEIYYTKKFGRWALDA